MSDPYVPGHGDASYSVQRYDLDLAYKPLGNRLSGTATVTARAGSRLDRFVLDLHALRVAKVTVDERPASWSHRGSRLTVRPSRPVAAGQGFAVRVKYAGSPRPVPSRTLGGAGWEELADGAIVAAQPHGAPSWFPCNDRPDDKATYALTMTVPADYHVAFSGVLLDRVRRGASMVWRYEQPAPMATYLASAQVGRYERTTLVAGPVPVHLVAPADLDGPGFEAAFGQLGAMLDHFTSRFGPYPFADYTVVITDDDLEIPLESQAMATFGRNFCVDDWDAIRLVGHELAHQWFGNAVTLRCWRDIWLHEGFACYAEWLWAEESGRRPAAEWAREHHGWLARLGQDLLLGDPGPALMFDDRVYKRGALTLHALRRELGDHAFFDVLRTWVGEHAGGSVTTADLVAHVERVTGRSVQALVDAWVHRRELPPFPG